jgi:hypothetical protein
MAQHEQERQSDRHPPEADRHRPDVREADQQRPEGKCDVAEEQCGEGEAVRRQGPYCSRSR